MSQSDKTPDPGFRLPDPALVTRTMADVAERSQRIVADFVRRQGDSAEKLAGRAGGTPQVEGGTPLDPFNLGGAFMEMASRLMANPARLMQAQMGFWQDYLTLWGNTARRMMGGEVKPVISEDSKDKRFKDDAWRENEVFDFIKQSYLLSARYFQTVVGSVEGLDQKAAQKVD
ncbi:MAG: class I poly(R)-hydroxyalkanoic acid synthase, partial [Escherichia coli]